MHFDNLVSKLLNSANHVTHLIYQQVCDVCCTLYADRGIVWRPGQFLKRLSSDVLYRSLRTVRENSFLPNICTGYVQSYDDRKVFLSASMPI